MGPGPLLPAGSQGRPPPGRCRRRIRLAQRTARAPTAGPTLPRRKAIPSTAQSSAQVGRSAPRSPPPQPLRSLRALCANRKQPLRAGGASRIVTERLSHIGTKPRAVEARWKEAYFLARYPGLDPGAMNSAVGEPDAAVFMESGLRRNDEGGPRPPPENGRPRPATVPSCLCVFV